MERRTASIEETRKRIIDATVELHDEKGILATTMQDIAARAGVALGTVYRHFPTLDELVPACGGRIIELDPPPNEAVFNHLHSAGDRYGALIRELFEHYARMERRYEYGLAEARSLPVLRQFMERFLESTRQLVAAAIAPASSAEDQRRLAVALSDVRAWQAIRQAGFSNDEAIALVTRMVAGALPEAAGIGESEGGA